MTHPSLYQINTRVLLRELGPRATLDDVPESLLDRLAGQGFDWVWFLGVWQTGPEARRVSRTQPDWRRDFAHVLPDLTDDDICGSPFAVRSYTVNADFGGDAALARLRQRVKKRGLRLMLDFVPNHMAPDHPWVESHPEFFIRGTDELLAREPQNWRRVDTAKGPLVLAYGRDPYFPGWPDTLQLNYRHRGLRQAQIEQLTGITTRCDGVRCDMAMLVLPDVFRRTWGDLSRPSDGTPPDDEPFWPRATAATRKAAPGFTFMAEAYWDTEWRLQQEGFDYTYDKRLYDRLRAGDAGQVRGHLNADAEYQRRSARFLENHDEPRAAAVFAPGMDRAAAVITFLTPGLRFFHDGQFEGYRTHISMHLCRRPLEQPNAETKAFYDKLLAVVHRPEVRTGRWRQLEPRPAWDGNPTWNQFVCFAWEAEGRQLVVCVHYGPTQGQCRVPLPLDGLRGRSVVLGDLLTSAKYQRNGDDLSDPGLFLDMPPWGYHAFEVG